MSDKKSPGLKTWQGRPITSDRDSGDLDRMAAVNEFHHKQPRDIAEDEAYRTYQKDQHVAGAAHHFAGMTAARGAGDNEAAKKHSDLYSFHVKKLGKDPIGPVPEEVKAHHAKKLEEGTAFDYKGHPSDSLLLDGAKEVN